MKRFLLLVWAVSLTVLIPVLMAGAANKAKELKWEELVPNNISIKKMEQLMSKAAVYTSVDSVSFNPEYFPAVKALNGKLIKIPGYVVPLDFDAKKIDEFLLVPYMGACTHTPPPPPNQIIYIKMKKKIAVKSLYDAVMVQGVMSVKTKKSEIANAVYTMSGHSIGPYK